MNAGPYTVTTKRESRSPIQDGPPNGDGYCRGFVVTTDVVSRVAVATLEEARPTFGLRDLREGDRVLLLFNGYRLPKWLGGAWADVLGTTPLGTTPRGLVRVAPHCEPNVERRVGLGNIGRVERDGALIASRVSAPGPAWTRLAWTLPESGGTVGPLPDGTVILVRKAAGS